MIALAGLGVLVGVLLPVQTAVNTRLGRRAGAVWSASFISFVVGTLLLAVALALFHHHVAWGVLPHQPWWIWIGGVCGVIYLTGNLILMRALGASASVVLPIVGQVLGGALIDTFGLFGSKQLSLGVHRIEGTLLVIASAALVNLRRRVSQPGHHGAAVLPLAGLAVVAGCLSAVQTTVNGRLGAVSGSSLLAATVSFVIGTLALAVVVPATRSPLPLARVAHDEPPWIWVGGAIGALFVLVNAAIAPTLGTGLTVSAVLLGQILAGIIIDQWGLLGAGRRPVTPLRLIGAACVLGGVALVRFG